MRLRECYLLALALCTAAFFLPLPRLGVSVVPQRQKVLGYEREAFGGWERDGACDTRARTIAAQGAAGPAECSARPKPGPILDPYSAAVIPAGAAVEVDHVFPLAAAWDLGAHEWDADRRRRFANDPRNLVATSRALNQAKSDSLPSRWLPPAHRCAYSRQLAGIAREYSLPLPAADVAVMRRQCRFEFVAPTR